MSTYGEKPPRGSVQYHALEIMYRNGGSAAINDLKALSKELAPSSWRLNRCVIEPLTRRSMAFEQGGRLVMRQEGYKFMQRAEMDRCDKRKVQQKPNEVVQSRYIPAQREMLPGPIGVSHRDGADDYRGWPSRYGDKRVPHG